MKNFKRIQAMFLAVIMAVMTLGTTTAFAAEPLKNNTTIVASDEQVSTMSIFPTTYTDSVYCGGGARGNDFTVDKSKLSFTASFYDAESWQVLPNGVVILAVRLYDNTAGNVLAQEWQSSYSVVSGSWNVTPGHTYHFEYLIAYGNRGLNITNKIKNS